MDCERVGNVSGSLLNDQELANDCNQEVERVAMAKSVQWIPWMLDTP